jgi:hypothetical protein
MSYTAKLKINRTDIRKKEDMKVIDHTTRKDNNDDSDTATTTEDPSVLIWERIQEKEKDTMNSISATSSNVSNDDIIEIDAGGKIIKALRSALTLAPDTMFSYMFGGRWEESLRRDSNGRVFIDEDSELIEIIINFLRMKKREDPSQPTRSPKVRDDKKDDFASLLNYYGSTGFFHPTPVFLPLDIASIDFVPPFRGNFGWCD